MNYKNLVFGSIFAVSMTSLMGWIKKTREEIDSTERQIESARNLLRKQDETLAKMHMVSEELAKSGMDEYLEELKKEFNVEGP